MDFSGLSATVIGLIGRIFGAGPARAASLAVFAMLLGALRVLGQPIIEDIAIDFRGDVAVRVAVRADRYYVLLRGDSVGQIDIPVDLQPGQSSGSRILRARQIVNPDGSFFRVREIPLSAAQDTDGDGVDDLTEILRNFDPLDPASTPAPEPRPPTSISSSPANGELDVAVTRETIVYFSNPLSKALVLSQASLGARHGARRLLTRAELSADRRKATLYYLEPLPGGAEIRVLLDGTQLLDEAGDPVDVDGDGRPGGEGEVVFTTARITGVPSTIVCGRVFASELAASVPGQAASSINTPLAGVTITVDGMEETVRSVTDALGNFRLTNCPSGPFFVHIDGRTVVDVALGIRYPDQAYYPFVGKQWASEAGREVNIGDVFLPLVVQQTLTPTSATDTTVIRMPDAVLTAHPEFEGVRITIAPNSLYSDNGTRGGRVGLAPVPPDRLPGPLPAGVAPALVITVQTDGPTNFDEPAPVCFPNLPDTDAGEALPPGARSALWSFNHDSGQWEVIGPMTVSEDGRLVCTDPGVGILQPGWHFVSGNCAGGGGEPECGTLLEPPVPEGYEMIDNDDAYRVRFFSGEFYENAVDLRVAGIGFDLEWRRQYRSRVYQESAQGNQWDHSYNIRIEKDVDGYRVRQGAAREDFYRPRQAETWVHNGYFRELVRNPDGSFTQTFADFKKWEFHPVGAGALSGRIRKMEDRFGNKLEFEYDPSGRLIKVFDPDYTAGGAEPVRQIKVAYNAEGLIDRVEGPESHRTKYEYYRAGDEGGAAGDLKRVERRVAVPFNAGIPQPPPGLGPVLESPDHVVEYSYSKGFADTNLNHNLLSIRSDGVLWLTNSYGLDAIGGSNSFDRVILQRWGAEGDKVKIEYSRLEPCETCRFACWQARVLDRNTNDTHYYYDAGNRLVKVVQFGDETAGGAGGIGGLARDEFVTEADFNFDNQPTWRKYPNGLEVLYEYEGDRKPEAEARTRGNLVEVRRRGTERPENAIFAGQPGALLETVEKYEYKATFGQRFFGLPLQFVTKYTDPRGNTVDSTYDDWGLLRKRVHGEKSIVEEWDYNDRGQPILYVHPEDAAGRRRRDRSVYHAGSGYLKESILDDANLRLTSRYEYDRVGNVVRITDPRGASSDTVYDSADQVVRTLGPALPNGARYQHDHRYDARGNRVESRQANFGPDGELADPPYFATTSEFDELNMVLRRTLHSSGRPDDEVVTEFAYDRNRNLTLTRSPEAVAGAQPGNVVQRKYRDRNLLAKVTRAPGTADESITEYEYDANGVMTATVEGSGDASRRTEMAYDSLGRLLQTRDPMGNVSAHQYDLNGNLTNTIVLGELLDVPGSAGNRRLSELSRFYDAANRETSSRAAFFDLTTGAPIGTGEAIRRVEYSPASQVVRSFDPRGNVTTFEFDTALRTTKRTDAEGNEVLYVYDEAGNVIESREREKSQLDERVEEFVTRSEYDPLQRLVRVEDSAGNVSRFLYDSRGNQVSAEDPRGNVTTHRYDGLGRLVRTARILTDTGDGEGRQIGEIELSRRYDRNSRMVAYVDDHGHESRYEFDNLDRMVLTVMADASRHRTRYDLFNNPTNTVDANSNVVSLAYDRLNRLTRKEIEPGSGVSTNTTFEEYRYDGLSRVVYAADDDSKVDRRHDSFGEIVSERVRLEPIERPRRDFEVPYDSVVETERDPVGNLVSARYPDGRELRWTHDRLNRVRTISEGPIQQAAYDYVGPRRIERLRHGNGTVSRYWHDGAVGEPGPEGDHGVRRVVRIDHGIGELREQADEIFLRQQFAWDRTGNKTRRTIEAAAATENEYGYDSANRLVLAALTVGATVRTNRYDLDDLGNRLRSIADGTTNDYFMHTNGVAKDFEVNQYTSTPFDERGYDENGNLSTVTNRGPPRAFLYDYRNQLVAVQVEGGRRTTFAYDPFGRRLEQATQDAGGEGGEPPPPQVLRQHYLGSRVCLESGYDGATTTSFLWGRLDNHLLAARRADGELRYHADDLGHVMAVSDAEGKVVERYDYDDYGRPRFLSPAGSELSATAVANDWLYSAKRLNPDLGLYHHGARYLDPEAGRFITRDPVGTRDGPNLVAYASNNPWSLIDLGGLEGSGSTEQPVSEEGAAQEEVPLPATDPVPRTVSPPSGATASSEGSQTAQKPGLIDRIAAAWDNVIHPPAKTHEWRGWGNGNWEELRKDSSKDASLMLDVAGWAGVIKAAYEYFAGEDLVTRAPVDPVAAGWNLGLSLLGPVAQGVKWVAGIGKASDAVLDSRKSLPGGGAEVVSEGFETTARGTSTTVEQYALKATESGFYPVMKRGYAAPQAGVWLEAGDVWKYGTTQNPATRYPLSFYEKWRLRYEPQTSGSKQVALEAEKTKILSYRDRNGMLPPGNKIVK